MSEPSDYIDQTNNASNAFAEFFDIFIRNAYAGLYVSLLNFSVRLADFSINSINKNKKKSITNLAIIGLINSASTIYFYDKMAYWGLPTALMLGGINLIKTLSEDYHQKKDLIKILKEYVKKDEKIDSKTLDKLID